MEARVADMTLLQSTGVFLYLRNARCIWYRETQQDNQSEELKVIVEETQCDTCFEA
jgi:hypothetical protein